MQHEQDRGTGHAFCAMQQDEYKSIHKKEFLVKSETCLDRKETSSCKCWPVTKACNRKITLYLIVVILIFEFPPCWQLPIS